MRDARSFIDVIHDIFGNLEDIVRAEMRLAKAEVTNELRSARPIAVGFGLALVGGVFAVLFLLLSAMFALSLVLTEWGAALVVAGGAALVSAFAFIITARRMRAPLAIAPRTTSSIQEDVACVKQSIK